MPVPPFSSAPTPDATSTKKGKLVLANDLGGTAAAPQVVAAHLSAALPILQGGTGQTTAQAAVDALLPSQTSNSGKFLTTNGSASSWGAAPSDTPWSVDHNASSHALTSLSQVKVDGTGLTSPGYTNADLVLNTTATIAAGLSQFASIYVTGTKTITGNVAAGQVLEFSPTVSASGSSFQYQGVDLAHTVSGAGTASTLWAIHITPTYNISAITTAVGIKYQPTLTTTPGTHWFLQADSGQSYHAGAFSVGHTNAPNTGTKLDISGGLTAQRKSTITLSNGVNSDITLPASSFVTVTGPTAAFSITGIANGVDGAIVRIVNLTGQNMTMTHQATSSAANQITSMTGASAATTGNGVAELQYDTGSSKWILTYLTA